MDSAAMAMIASSSHFFRLSNDKIYGNIENRISFRKSLRLQCVSNPNPISCSPLKSNINTQNRSFSTSCSGSSLGTFELAKSKLQSLVTEFQSLPEPIDRVKRLLHYATLLPPFHESRRVTGNRVMGCTAQVWLDASLDEYGRMRFSADSDSEITKGFCSCLILILDGALPEEVLGLKTEDLASLNVGLPGRGPSRVNTWHNVLISMRKRTKALVAAKEGKAPLDPFPSLVITPEGIQAKGSYAEAQLISME